MDRQIDGQTDRRLDRRTDNYIHRQIDGPENDPITVTFFSFEP